MQILELLNRLKHSNVPTFTKEETDGDNIITTTYCKCLDADGNEIDITLESKTVNIPALQQQLDEATSKVQSIQTVQIKKVI